MKNSRDTSIRFNEETGGIPFAIGRELSAIFTLEIFRQYIPEILLHSNYEETDLEKLAREVAFRPARQTDPAKLARQVDLSPARDDALVPHQKEHRDDALAI